MEKELLKSLLDSVFDGQWNRMFLSPGSDYQYTVVAATVYGRAGRRTICDASNVGREYVKIQHASGAAQAAIGHFLANHDGWDAVADGFTRDFADMSYLEEELPEVTTADKVITVALEAIQAGVIPTLIGYWPNVAFEPTQAAAQHVEIAALVKAAEWRKKRALAKLRKGWKELMIHDQFEDRLKDLN